jgi:hypothetical protein
MLLKRHPYNQDKLLFRTYVSTVRMFFVRSMLCLWECGTYHIGQEDADSARLGNTVVPPDGSQDDFV